MTISQQRMIALINAALDYKGALEDIQALANAEFSQARYGAKSWQAAADAVALYLARDMMLNHPTRSAEIISVEAAHFKRFKRRNDRNADWMRRKRAGETHAQVETAPQSLVHAPAPSPIAREMGFGRRGDKLDFETRAAIDAEIDAMPPTPEPPSKPSAPILATSTADMSPEELAALDRQIEERKRQAEIESEEPIQIETDDPDAPAQ